MYYVYQHVCAFQHVCATCNVESNKEYFMHYYYYYYSAHCHNTNMHHTCSLHWKVYFCVHFDCIPATCKYIPFKLY